MTSGGTQTIGATGAIGFTTLLATAGDIDVTGATMTGGTLTTQAGAVTLASTGTGDTSIDVSTVSAATTFGATASAGGITLGSATSQGTQTLLANNDLAFTTLTTKGAGSIDLTSTVGAVEGQGGSSLIASNADVTISGATVQLDTVTAVGKASIDAATTLAGTSLTTGGDASLVAGVSTNLTPTNPVSLAWTTVNAGTTFEAQAYGGSITSLGSVTSGGTQTIGATKDVGFTTLLATAGDIDVTSSAGSIAGTMATANGAADLSAYGDNTGATLTAQTSSVTLSSTVGKIDWARVNAATTFGATASGGGVTLGSATSGGSQTIEAMNDLVYTTLTTTGTATDPGDVNLRSLAGAVRGGSIYAHGFVTANGVGIDFDQIDALAGLTLNSSADVFGNGFTTSGSVIINAAGSVEFGDVNAGSISLSTPGNMTFNKLMVATAMDLAANNLSIGLVTQDPRAKGPLELTITGYKGSVGTSAELTIDASNGIDISQLREVNATITTTALQITMGDPTITNTLLLTTPDQVLVFDDASSRPQLGNNVQFYQPSDDFYLMLNGRSILTNSFIVQYDAEAQVQQYFEGALINGPSFVRDFDRLGRVGEEGFGYSSSGDDSTATWYFPVEAFDRHLAAMKWRPVAKVGSEPAVNMNGAALMNPRPFTAVFTRTRD